jgi:hypothetical protein
MSSGDCIHTPATATTVGAVAGPGRLMATCTTKRTAAFPKWDLPTLWNQVRTRSYRLSKQCTRVSASQSWYF